MAGPVAAMADAPQILVPTPIRVDSLSPIPNFRPNQRAKKYEKKTTMSALTTPIPTCSHIKALVTIPKAAMTPLRKSVAQKLVPGKSLSGNLTTFVMTML